MADCSLNDLSPLLNPLIQSQEYLGDILTKASVLLDVAIDCELLNYPAAIVYPYFSAVSDFLRQATELQEEILKNILQNQTKDIGEEQYA